MLLPQFRNFSRIIGRRGPQILVVDSESLAPEERSFLAGAKAYSALTVFVVSSREGEESNLGPTIAHTEGADALAGRIEDVTASILASLPRRSPRGASDPLQLTTREREIAQMVAKGLSNQKIAEKLRLRPQSVGNAVSGIMRKLRCENRVQIVLELIRHGSAPDLLEWPHGAPRG